MIIKVEKIKRSNFGKLVLFLESNELLSPINMEHHAGDPQCPINIRDYKENSGVSDDEHIYACPISCSFTLNLHDEFIAYWRNGGKKMYRVSPSKELPAKIFDILDVFPGSTESASDSESGDPKYWVAKRGVILNR